MNKSLVYIRNSRISKGFTQESLAHLIGISKDHYAKIERGIAKPSVYIGLKICLHLEIEPFSTWLINEP